MNKASIFVVVLILLIVFTVIAFVLSGKLRNPQGSSVTSTIIKTNTTSKEQNTTTTINSTSTSTSTTVTTTIAFVNITEINEEWTYSGPAYLNATTQCNYVSRTSVDNVNAKFYGNQTFLFPIQISSNSCPLTVTSMQMITPGFKFISSIPSLPFGIPPYSNAALQFKLETPTSSFSGPLTIRINTN